MEDDDQNSRAVFFASFNLSFLSSLRKGGMTGASEGTSVGEWKISLFPPSLPFSPLFPSLPQPFFFSHHA